MAPWPAVGQTPNTQDCAGAIPVCQDVFTQDKSFSGTGNVGGEITMWDSTQECLETGEKNDVWYTFTVQLGGNLCFSITPNDLSDDYDWAVYNLTDNVCSDIATVHSIESSCNYSATPGVTGPDLLSTQPIDQNNPCVNVVAGQTYVVNVSNYSSTQSGYKLDFTASTAHIRDDVPPTLPTSAVVTPVACNARSLSFRFSENILCSTVSPGDFQVMSPSGSPIAVTTETGASCAAGGTQERTFTVNLASPLSATGTYNLCLGSSAGSVTDLCHNVAQPVCIPFAVDCPPCSRIQTVGNVICEVGPNGQLTGNFVWTFNLTNLSGKPVSHLYFDNLPPGVTVNEPNLPSDPHMVFNPPIPPGGVRQKTVIIHGATSGQTLPIQISLFDAAFDPCCSFLVSLAMPNCHCAQIYSDVKPSCLPFLPPPYNYTFNLQNLEPSQISSVIATAVTLPNTPIPPGVIDVATVPIHLPNPIGMGEKTGNQTVHITGSGALPGSQLCLLLSLHDLTCEHCCAIPTCFNLPSCFIDDTIFFPIGDAVILFTEEGLRVSGIGSSGKDGVEVKTSGASAVELGWLPLAPASPDASISVGAAVHGGASEHLLGSLQVTGSAAGYEIAADLSGVGSGPRQVDIFDSTTIVASTTSKDGTVARVSGWPVGGGAAIVTTDNPKSPAGYSLFLNGPSLTWTLPGGSPVVGDRLRVTAAPASAAIPLSSLTVQAANIPQITIASGDVQPPSGASCAQTAEALCLAGGRFKVEVEFSGAGAIPSSGHAFPLTSDTGYFWFFDADNIELVVKLVDGRPVNGHWWVFAGALSDVAYTITVTDTVTGSVRSYVNPAGRLASLADTLAFTEAEPTSAEASFFAGLRSQQLRPRHASLPASDSVAACVPGPETLCLGSSRFRVTVAFKNDGNERAAKAVSLTGKSGYFWFFDAANVEIVLKVLDGRLVNGHWWVFFAALSDVEYTVTVTDTETGVVRTYHNPQGVLASRADTQAF